MSNVQLGFQGNNQTGPTFFNATIQIGGKAQKISHLLAHATNGGNPVKIPDNFHVIEILLSSPSQLGKNGSVTVVGPAATQKLNENTTTVKTNASVSQITVQASN